MKKKWVEKSKDDRVSVMIEVDRKGNPTGKHRYNYNNSTSKSGKIKYLLPKTFYLGLGFLAGLIFEAIAKFH